MTDHERQTVSTTVAPPRQSSAKGSLRHTLTIAMVLMTVVPALSGAVLLGVGGRALIRAEVFRHMQSIADSVSLDLQHGIEARLDRANTFAHRLYVQQASLVLATGVPTQEIRATAARALLTAQMDDLSMPSGRREGFAVIVSLPGGRPLAWAGMSAADAAATAAYHKANLPTDTGRPWLSPPHLHVGNQIPVMCFIAPIHPQRADSGRPVAALIWSVALKPTVYATIEARQGLGETGEIVLVDHNGLALKDLRYEPNTRFRKTIQAEPVRRALRGEKASFVSLDYRGKPVVAAMGQVPATGWGVVAKMDVAEAYAGIARLTWLWVALMAGLLLVGTAAARRLSRHLLRPVEQLSHAAHGLAEGELTVPLDTGRTDELGQMARDFDEMAARVASARSTLEVAMVQEREARDYLDNLLDHANAPIMVWSPGLRITRFNHAFERLTGWTEDEVLGQPVSLLLPETELQRQMDVIALAALGEHWEAVEIPIQHRDGSLRTLLWSSAAVYGRDGVTAVATIAQGQDITTSKTTQEALRASEAQYRSLFETMTQGVIYQSADGLVTSANSAAERVLGLSLAQLQGRTSADPRWQAVDENLVPVPGEQHPSMVALRTGQTVSDFVMGVYSPLAEGLRWLLISAVPQFRAGESKPYQSFALFTDITERKAAEDALRASEARYRSLFTHMLNGLAHHEIVVDEQGQPVDYRFLEVNAAFEAMLGLTREQVVGRLASELFPELQRSWIETYGQVALQGTVARFEEFAEGLGRWFEVQAYCPHHGQFITLFDDITERKNAEATLRQSEAKFATAFQISPYAIAITRAADGRFVDVNDSFTTITGFTREEALSSGSLSLALWANEEDRRSVLATLGAGGAVFGQEYLFRTKHGGLITGLFSAQMIELPEGPCVLSSISDITESKHAQEALRQSEARFRSVFNEAAVGIAVTAMDGTHLDCNNALLGMVGLTRDQFLTTRADQFTHPDDQNPDPTPWLELLAGKRASYQRDVRYLRPDGSVVSTRLTVSLVEYGNAGELAALAMMLDITERKAAEEALQRVLARLQAIIDSSPAAIIIQSPTHGIELYSPAAETLFGWETEEVLGLQFAPYVGARFEAEATALRRRITAGETITGHETQRQRRDGSLIDVSISMAPIAEGEPGRFVAVVSDISESKQMARALQESHARLKAIIASSPAAIVISDWEGHIELYSPAAERMFGWREDEVIGGEAPHVPPDAREAIGHVLREVRAGRTVNAFETYRLRRDGSRVAVSISIAPLTDPDGESRRFIAVITDISERLRAEREAEERTALEQLVQVTQRMLAETNRDGLLGRLVEGVRELTEAGMATAAYGYADGGFAADALSAATELGRCPTGGAFRAIRTSVHLKLVANGAPMRLTDAEIAALPTFRLPDAHIPVRGFMGAPLTDASREIVGMIMASNKAGEGAFSARDEALLTQLAELASLALRHLDLNLALTRQTAELGASNRELASFSHSVSHDLRAPLRAVDGFSQALLEDYGDKLDAQALNYLSRLRAATQRMGELIDDLLQLSRVTREPMRWEEVDLSAVAAEVAAELAESDPTRTVAWTIQPGLTVTGHARLCGVLLRNLLGNAWKFTGKAPNAAIEFGTEEVEGETVCFVKDNGAGFDMAYAGKLFAPFQRLHSMEEFPGNGVGLAIVQRVVNRHGGRVWAEAAVNQGATFRFTLGARKEGHDK